jgi:hypothetical protein
VGGGASGLGGELVERWGLSFGAALDILGSLESGSQVRQVSENAQLGGIRGTFPRTSPSSFRNS